MGQKELSISNKSNISSDNLLKELETRKTELFHNGDKTYATFTSGNRLETAEISSKRFGMFLSKVYYDITNGRGMQKTTKDAMVQTLQAKAMFEGEEREVYLRTAPLPCGGFELDLNDDAGNCVQVTQSGWLITNEPTNCFVRPEMALSLPEPTPSGNIDLLWDYVNVAESDRPLMLGWLLWAFQPNGPFPLLILQGEQNSAKSTTMSNLRSIIDPTKSDRRGLPRQDREIFYAAQNNWVMSYDNLQTIKPELSDTFCRIATGGAHAERRLYTNEEMHIEVCRPVLLNGIEDIASRPDLESRAIILMLPKLQSRKSPTELQAKLEKDKPAILGALLDACVVALQEYATITLPKTDVRFPDCMSWMTAAEEELGFEEGSFNTALVDNVQQAKLQNLANDGVAMYLLRFLNKLEKPVWEGSASQLLKELEAELPTNGRKPKSFWVETPKALTGHLSRISPLLAEVGVEYERPQRTAKLRPILLRKLGSFSVDGIIGTADNVQQLEEPSYPFDFPQLR